jgi:hypothetical protein
MGVTQELLPKGTRKGMDEETLLQKDETVKRENTREEKVEIEQIQEVEPAEGVGQSKVKNSQKEEREAEPRNRAENGVWRMGNGREEVPDIESDEEREHLNKVAELSGVGRGRLTEIQVDGGEEPAENQIAEDSARVRAVTD